MNETIKLGDKVRDKVTGFIGIAVYRTEFLNGCIQFGVMPKTDKNNKIPEEIGIDIQSIELVHPLKKKVSKKETGGPMTRNFVRRNF